MPPEVLPARVSSAVSKALWFTTRNRLVTSGPNIRSSSSGVFSRWVPVAIRTTMRSGGTWESSPRSTGKTVALGMGLVMSHTDIATDWSDRTSRRSGSVPTGLRREARMAPASSGRLGT